MKVPEYYNQAIKDILVDAEERSADWVSCAVGNQCTIIPRDLEDGQPLDERLSGLGIQFNKDIEVINETYNAYDYDKLRFIGALKLANDTMEQIEERSLLLIMKELEKQNK